MSGLQWEAPPASSTTSGGWESIADQLRANPGEWAVVATGEKDAVIRSKGSWLKRGAAAGWREGDFEVTGRRQDGLTKLYARYVGEPS